MANLDISQEIVPKLLQKTRPVTHVEKMDTCPEIVLTTRMTKVETLQVAVNIVEDLNATVVEGKNRINIQ